MRQKNYFLSVIAAMFAFAPAALAQEANADVLGFDSEPSNNVAIEQIETDGSWSITTTGDDPFAVSTPLAQDLAEGELTLTFEYKATKDDDLELFFSTGANTTFSADMRMSFGTAPAAEEWTRVNVDITKAVKEWGWGKAGSTLRVDFGLTSGLRYNLRDIRFTSEPANMFGDLEVKDGVVQINSQEDFDKWVAAMNGAVLGGALLADYDVDLNADVKAVSTEGRIVHEYNGVFNGNYHTIDLDIHVTGVRANFMNYLNGTMKNLYFTGELESDQNFMGTVAMDINSTGYLENIYSSVNLRSNKDGDGTHGGLAGRIVGGSVKNVVYAGKISSPVVSEEDGTYLTTWCGGVIGWSQPGSKFENVIMIGDISEISGEYVNAIVRDPSNNATNYEVKNVFAVDINPSISRHPDVYSITKEELASGMACFLMNGDQEDITWWQTLGEDLVPTFDNRDGSHKQVYAVGSLKCDGSPKGDDVTFNNDGGDEIPEHSFVDGVCEECGADQPGFVELVDGWYVISTAEQLSYIANFASKNPSINIKIAEDLDMSGYDYSPITGGYSGIFDGQGHTISNLIINNPDTRGQALIAQAGPCTVKNLTLDHTCSITGGGYSAGFVGESTAAGTLTLENLFMHGTVVCNGANGAAIYACNMGNAATGVIIKNCGMSGSVQTNAEGGQISGWTGGSMATLTNCWAIAKAEYTRAGDDVQLAAPATTNYVNCYSIQGFGNGVTLISEDAGMTGELTWLLNGKSFVNPTWYQNLDEGDAYPSLDPSRGIVYPVVGGYATVFPDDEASFESFKSSFSEVAAEFLESEDVTTYAQPSLVAEYAELVAAYETAETMADFEAAYKAEMAKKAEVQASINAYKNYDAEIQTVIAELAAQEGLAGPDFDNLMEYLEGGLEPGASQVAPNGGYEYIMENRLLTPEQIETEITWVKELLRYAIAGGYEAGADITNLLANATFADGFNGWEGVPFTNVQQSKAEGNDLYGVEGFGSKPLHMYQTIAVSKAGVYELKVGGAWRPFNTWDPNSFDYYPYIYINGNATYLPAVAEEYVPVEEAEDGVNFNQSIPLSDLEVKDAEGNVIGYVMQAPQGICIALASGRYDNRILVNLNEGDSLTIGINQPLSEYQAGANEWVGIGDIHLWYRGELSESEEAVDRVLTGMLKRANNLLAIESATDDTYKKFPNWSQSIKDRIAASIAKADGADVATKYEVIEELSAAFLEAIDSKKAYRNFFAESERAYSSVYAASAIDPAYDTNVLTQAEAIQEAAMAAYTAGTMSTEEAAECEIIKPLNARPTIDENGTYHIGNTAQYSYFTDLANANTTDANGKIYNVVLDADVYMNTEMIIQNFYGTFDGQDHTLNVDINRDVDGAAPFIALRKGATVKNLIVRGDIVAGAKFAAGIAAHSYEGSNMDRIQSHVNIQAGLEGDGTHGGILAVNDSGTGIISNSLFAGSLVGSSSNCNGGIVGWSGSDARAINCLVIANIAADPTSSNIIGRNATSAQNCFYTTPYGGAPEGATQITDADLLSGMVTFGLNGGSTRADVAWRQDLGNDIMPTLDPTHKVVYMTADSTYTNEPQNEIEKHLGTAEDPFLVATTADMAILRKLMVPGRVNYVKLTADIDMAGITEWVPLNMYEDEANGHQYQNLIDFDGQGHVISNFTDNDFTDNYNSFFGILNGDVRNVGFANVDVSCTQSGTGVLAGYMGHDQYANAEGVKLTSTMTNVWVTGKLHVTSSYAGGLVGNVGGPSVLKNVYTNIEITGDADYVGGLVGRLRDALTIENAYAAGTISKGGGIVGGGQKEDTAGAIYKNIVVWNNTDQNFGPIVEGVDQAEGISYSTGNNFADLQAVVVAWGSPWKCDMADGSYPTFDGSMADGINGVTIDTKGKIFNINGIQVEKTTKGIYIIDGKKVMVK